jgi:hypothetical protein
MPPPELPAWYANWVRHHATTFGLHAPEAVAAFAAWWPAFNAMGADHRELTASTYAVLNGGPAPMRLADHYQALRTALGTVRDAARAKADAVTHYDRGECADGCGDSGYVTVPHPRYCSAEGWRPHHHAAGRPVYATAAVTCRCDRGRRIHAQQQSAVLNDPKARTTMSLSDYEDRVNSNWRGHMEYRAAESKAFADIDAHAKASFENTMRQFAASTAMPVRSSV